MPNSSVSSSPRGTKRRRTTESPRGGGRNNSNPPQHRINSAAEGMNGLVGSSRDLLADEEEDGEPSTEEDEEDEFEDMTPRRRAARGHFEGSYGMRFEGAEESEEDDQEPDTENSDEGDEIAQPLPVASTSNGAARLSVPRPSPAVIDLTDDGDDSDDVILPPGRASLPRLKPSSSDDIVILPSSSSKPNNKGKSRSKSKSLSVPSPSPSPPPSAETSTSTTSNSGPSLPSLATLSCPICLGPPTPLALTACGHAFCAPCLHAALVAGPALTPPPPENARGRGGRGRARAGARARGRGRATAVRSRGRGRNGPGRGFAWASSEEEEDEEIHREDLSEGGDPELNKHCPVCRTPLYGGWGKSLRGLIIRMAPVKR